MSLNDKLIDTLQKIWPTYKEHSLALSAHKHPAHKNRVCEFAPDVFVIWNWCTKQQQQQQQRDHGINASLYNKT